METREADCKGCRATIRLAPGEIDRLLAQYLNGTTAPRAQDAEYTRRLAVCSSCPDLSYGTTCRHCGCLVALRAKLADKRCPSPTPHW